jgi:hypothetical protein
VITVGFTTYNILEVTGNYSETRDLRSAIGSQKAGIAELQNKSADLTNRIARIRTDKFVSETEFLNNAIERRTFSWTGLFDHFEEILPANVKMVSIRPTINEGRIHISQRWQPAVCRIWWMQSTRSTGSFVFRCDV